ncbi:hypothetical protein BG000_009895 [Podila horticola]|nr:hypothetical protein BG000_009895 [Podila horticola]
MPTEILATPMHLHPFSRSTFDDEDSDDDYWGQYGDREDAPSAKGPKDDDDDDIFSSESSPTSPRTFSVSQTTPWAPVPPTVAEVVAAHDEDSDDEYWQKYGDHDEDEEEDDDETNEESDSNSNHNSISYSHSHSLHEEECVESIGFETRRIFASLDPLPLGTTTGARTVSTSSHIVPTAPVPVLGQVDPTTLASLLERLVAEEEEEEEEEVQEEEEHVNYDPEHEESKYRPLFHDMVGQEQVQGPEQGQERAEPKVFEHIENIYKDIQGQGEEHQHQQGTLSPHGSRLRSLSGPASEEVINRPTTTTTLSLSERRDGTGSALSAMVAQDQDQDHQQQQQSPQDLEHRWASRPSATLPPLECVEEEKENPVSEKENSVNNVNNDNVNNDHVGRHGENEIFSFRSRSSSSSTVVSDPLSSSMSMSKAQILDSLKSLTTLALQAGLSKADLVQMLESVA